ncbi:Slx4p interacting protein [Paramarasmius palmivorus]|uniref:Slx4p interacting protein n=1 Tax=Paramarasmius palmivorus TaxID=297713 RepID=A0AAW0D6A0_9AGAR
MPLTRKPRSGTRSSLLSHTFPRFYACYLLKSIQTPTSKANYIGSTPDPPRRIRQHNGELTQGAFKTRSKRPWVMQMIVHGFPSKLAALQFEWAWQHPHKSRHIRDADGNKIFAASGRHLKQNIEILRHMVSNHPYNTWPLHLKIFTAEAQRIWENIVNPQSRKGRKKTAPSVNPLPLPQGFTVSVELEGVDGKSGLAGSGRNKAIDVKDDLFTAALLEKNADIAASKPHQCTVCKEDITDYAAAFLSQIPSSSKELPMIPRGGTCPGCSTYVLWGDIVKGLYRRAADGVSAATEEEEVDEANGQMFVSDTDDGVTSPGTSPKKKSKARRGSMSSSEGEVFDFTAVDHVSSASEDDEQTPMKARISTPRTTKAKAQRTPKPRVMPEATKKRNSRSSSGESFNFEDVDNMSFSDDEPPKRKRGRPLAAKTTARTPLFQKKRGAGATDVPRSPRKLHQVSATHADVRDLYDMATSEEDVPVESAALRAFSNEERLTRSMSHLSVSSPSMSPNPVMDISD